MPLYFAQSEGINPITSSWKSRGVKQIEAEKLPEMLCYSAPGYFLRSVCKECLSSEW